MLGILKYSGIASPRDLDRLELDGAWNDAGMSEDFLSELTDGVLNDHRRWKMGSDFLDFSIISFSCFCVSLGVFDIVPLNDHCPGPLSNLLIPASVSPGCVVITECLGLPADSLQPVSSFLPWSRDGALNCP